VKRRWPSLLKSVPCLPRSSPLGMKLEMIVARLRRSESFGLARPHARVWPIAHLACPMQTAARHLHPAVDHMGCACKHCCCALDHCYTAICQGRREPPRGRQSQSLEMARSTTAVHFSSPGEAARSVSGYRQRCSNLCMIAQDHRRVLYAVVQ
jgi:hypothetical protein